MEKGGEHIVKVGGFQVVIRPISVGKLEKVMGIIISAMAGLGNLEGKDGVEITKLLPRLVIDNFEKVFPLLIDDNQPSKGWIRDNITLPVMEEILEAAYVINGVGDFLGRLSGGLTGKKSPAMDPAASRSPGSITSSGSLTDGPQGKRPA